MKELKISKSILYASVLGLLVFPLLLSGCAKQGATSENSAGTSSASVQPTQTLNNLQTAFEGESNAEARYLAFATKADGEGYRKVASLFRAAARAEGIHAKNHSDVIRRFGATPTADIKSPVVKSTKENLEEAIKGESYERDTMYPDFLKQARVDGDKEALRTFNLARNAEIEHAKLYGEASNNLEAWKIEKQTFYVCPVCGFTTTNLNFEKCPSSYTPRERFLIVS